MANDAPTPLDRAMMDRALRLAHQAQTLGEVPVAAVVYKLDDGVILAEAHNRRAIDADPTAHAERLAITAAAHAIGDWRLTGCGLAVTLEPCCMCAGAIVLARLDRLIVAATDPKAGACGSLYQLTQDPRLNHRVTPIRADADQVDESATLLRAFFQQRRV